MGRSNFWRIPEIRQFLVLREMRDPPGLVIPQAKHFDDAPGTGPGYLSHAFSGPKAINSWKKKKRLGIQVPEIPMLVGNSYPLVI